MTKDLAKIQKTLTLNLWPKMQTGNADSGGGNDQGSSDQNSGVDLIDKIKIVPPKRYKVLLHNDDYTTMEFVILVLQRIFLKSHAEADKIMLEVHQRGVGVCGIYTYDVAETKRAKVIQFAKDSGHPLKCSVVPE
jgi:ATP-dependent Clp protease adaptor protein ClpS